MASQSAINFLDSVYAKVDTQVRNIIDSYPDPVDSIVINIQFDGGGSALASGQKGQIMIPAVARVVAARIFVGKDDSASSATVDVWFSDYDNYPTAMVSLHGTGTIPTLASAIKNDCDMDGWNNLFDRADHLAYRLTSFSGSAQHMTLALLCKKTGD
jgi:hypothetical protein